MAPPRAKEAAPAPAPGQSAVSRRLEKSATAFRTISEVAIELDVPQHVLRFWETRFPQVRPLKRGGGRRYYRPEDVELLRGIRSLLYTEGYTIKGVQRLMREGGFRERAEAMQAETPPPAPETPAIPETLTPAQRGELEAVLKELVSLQARLRQAAG
jgi:DNA-binding transcriptional MerR regulator